MHIKLILSSILGMHRSRVSSCFIKSDTLAMINIPEIIIIYFKGVSNYYCYKIEKWGAFN